MVEYTANQQMGCPILPVKYRCYLPCCPTVQSQLYTGWPPGGQSGTKLVSFSIATVEASCHVPDKSFHGTETLVRVVFSLWVASAVFKEALVDCPRDSYCFSPTVARLFGSMSGTGLRVVTGPALENKQTWSNEVPLND